MRLRGPARNALNQSPFAQRDDVESEEPILVESPLPRGRGSIAQIAPSESAEAERAADERAQLDSGGPGGSAAGESDSTIASPTALDPVAEPPAEDDTSGGVGATNPQIPATVRLVPRKVNYVVGEPVEVSVVVENANNIGSIPFHLRYNPSAVQFVAGSQSKGPFMESDGVEAVFMAAPIAGGGEIVVGLSRLGSGQGISGAGVVATFQFMAVGEGNAGFAFTGSSVKDPQARNLPATFAVVPVVIGP